jgi:hypothetical protein
MKHIPQKAPDGDCGVCCAALFLNQSYEEIMQSVPPDVIPHGLWIPELCHTIKKRADIDVAVVTYNKDLFQISQFDFPKEPVILGVLRLEAGNVFHYVFSDGVYLYDPMLPDKITLNQAKTDYHSGWLVVSMIKNP